MKNRLRRRILPLLAALLVAVLVIACPGPTPTGGFLPGKPDERPDPVPHPGPPPGHADQPSRWIPWPEPDVSHLIRMPPDPGPPPDPEPPEPIQPEPTEPERPAPVPKPYGPAAELAAFEAWVGHDTQPRWERLTHPPVGTPGPPGDDPPGDPPGEEPPDPPEEEPPGGGPVDEEGEKVVFGLQAIQHHPLTLAFVWATPIYGSNPDSIIRVSQYSGQLTVEATGKKHGFSQTPNPSSGGESESRRYPNLTPLGWYTFEVKAHFTNGVVGGYQSVRGQAPDVVPPLFPTLTGCAAVEQALADGDKVLYSGQCHSGSWTYFTNDARSQGGSALIIHPADAGTFVCGHRNETAGANGLWCNRDGNAEWALVGEAE